MDWNALGTWAAVVVALAISLKDTFQRWRDRTARHLLVAATIYPQIGQTQHALREVASEADLLLAEPSTSDQALRDASDAFLEIATDYGLQDLRANIDQSEALPEHILIPLAKAITLLRMLAHNGHAQRSSIQAPPRDELLEWCTQARAVLASLDWVELGIQRQMSSRRWKNPEQLEW